jgi:hypothetical protein
MAAADAVLLRSGGGCGQGSLRPVDDADGANGGAEAIPIAGLRVNCKEFHFLPPTVLIDRKQQKMVDILAMFAGPT